MKTNKKVLTFGILTLFALALVSAGLIQYYGKINQEVNVEQAVILNCEGNICNEVLDGISYEDFLVSDVYTLINLANTPRDVQLITSYDPEVVEGEITTSYNLMDTLILTKKEQINGIWTPMSGSELEIDYTVIGNTFESNAELPGGYILVYAMDNENRFSNYATVIKVEDIDASLPMDGDWNANAEPNYCDNNNGKGDYYENCVGAKIWAIPESDLDEEVAPGVYSLTWNNMTNYYWETDLITYTQENWDANPTILGESDLSFIVINEFNTDGFDGTITTEVIPA